MGSLAQGLSSQSHNRECNAQALAAERRFLSQITEGLGPTTQAQTQPYATQVMTHHSREGRGLTGSSAKSLTIVAIAVEESR